MWYYNGNPIKSIQEIKVIEPSAYGFVYKMTLFDKKTNSVEYTYIGKKNLYSKRKRKFGKREVLSMKDKRAKKHEYITKESDWKTYYSSNKFLKDNKNNYIVVREIIMFCTNDADLTYREAQFIICSDALEDSKSLNSGVSIRRFGNKLIE